MILVRAASIRVCTVGVVAVTVLALLPSRAAANKDGCATCLGSMTNDGTLWYAPTDNFRRGGVPFTKDKLPEIVMLGAQGDGATERMIWPMVKALSQFGTWTGLAPAARFCGPTGCELPTFDLTHAKIHSQYVAFVYRSIATRESRSLVDTLTPKQKHFFDKYVRAPGYHSDTGYFVWATEGGASGPEYDRLPGISIGPYLSLGTKIMIEGDFATTEVAAGSPGTIQSGLPFATVEQALAQADRVHYPSLVHDVNAEANLFTAVICKVDGDQPRKACNRSVVRGIAKHLK